MTLTDYMCQEEREEEDLPPWKIARIHRYNDLKSTEKSVEEDCLQLLEKILATQGPAERQ